ncbi:hypothetical protein EDC04DRAFT_2824174, partial [Pisolithus marmoratus]
MTSLMSVGEFHSTINFRFPVREVENDRVRLVPFVVSPNPHRSGCKSTKDRRRQLKPLLHAELFLQGSVNHPELFRFLPYGPFDSTAAFIEGLIEGFINKTSQSPSTLASPSEVDFAGTEIGAITILPPFQRTHTNELNSQSVRAAERMGFKREGTLRWDRALPSGKGKPGNSVQSRAGDPKPDCVGRHTAILAICWDDWENGGKRGSTEVNGATEIKDPKIHHLQDYSDDMENGSWML